MAFTTLRVILYQLILQNLSVNPNIHGQICNPYSGIYKPLLANTDINNIYAWAFVSNFITLLFLKV